MLLPSERVGNKRHTVRGRAQPPCWTVPWTVSEDRLGTLVDQRRDTVVLLVARSRILALSDLTSQDESGLVHPAVVPPVRLNLRGSYGTTAEPAGLVMASDACISRRTPVRPMHHVKQVEYCIRCAVESNSTVAEAVETVVVNWR